MSALGSTDKIESLSARRELSEAARALLADKAFGHVFRSLHEQWIVELLSTPHAGPERDELVAALKALDRILKQLGLLLTDYSEAAKKAARHG
jgi:hypothetical protein